MSIRVRRISDLDAGLREFADAAAIHAALDANELSGRDEYLAEGDEWVPLDEHPDYSTTDARGMYPTIVHAIVFVKVLVYLVFVAALRGTPGDLLGGWAIYTYAVLIGDAVAVALAYRSQNEIASWILWVFGVATFPLGLFLMISAKMTRGFRLRLAKGAAA